MKSCQMENVQSELIFNQCICFLFFLLYRHHKESYWAKHTTAPTRNTHPANPHPPLPLHPHTHNPISTFSRPSDHTDVLLVIHVSSPATKLRLIQNAKGQNQKEGQTRAE